MTNKLKVFIVTFTEGTVGAIASYFFPNKFLLIGLTIGLSGLLAIILIEYIENFWKIQPESSWEQKSRKQDLVEKIINSIFIGLGLLFAIMCWSFFRPQNKTILILLVMCFFGALVGFIWAIYIYWIVNVNWQSIKSDIYKKDADYRKLLISLIIMVPLLIVFSIFLHEKRDLPYESSIYWFYLIGGSVLSTVLSDSP